MKLFLKEKDIGHVIGFEYEFQSQLWVFNFCFKTSVYQRVFVVSLSFSLFEALFFLSRGSWGSSSRSSRNSSRSFANAVSSAKWIPCGDQARLEMYVSHLVLFRPVSLLPVGVVSMTWFASLSWSILVTYPNHRSWDQSMRKSRGSTFRGLWILVLRIWSNSIDFTVLTLQFTTYTFLKIYFLKHTPVSALFRLLSKSSCRSKWLIAYGVY